MSESITYNMTKQGRTEAASMNPRYVWITVACFLLMAVMVVIR